MQFGKLKSTLPLHVSACVTGRTVVGMILSSLLTGFLLVALIYSSHGSQIPQNPTFKTLSEHSTVGSSTPPNSGPNSTTTTSTDHGTTTNVPSTVPVPGPTTTQRPQLPPPTTNVVGHPNTSHGTVIPSNSSSNLPAFLVCVRNRESRGNYRAVNPQSGAGGAYQFMRSTWAAMGFATRYGTQGAEWASPAQQDEAAIETLRKVGTSPWGGSCG